MYRSHSSYRKQRGVTMLGWVFLLIPVAVVLYSGIRLAPIYLNYGKVVRTMERTASESQPEDSLALIRAGLGKRLDIEIIEFPDLKDFNVRRDGQSWVIEVNYEERVPLVANLFLLTSFSKSVRVGKGSAE